MKLSVLMSVYCKESPAFLCQCLDSLVSQTLQADEVVIVEDGPLGKALEASIASYQASLPIVSLSLPVNVGLGEALRAGLQALAAASDAIVVTLGDQPAIDARAIDRGVNARDGVSAAVRAAYGGRPGHPVLIEHELFERVAGLEGDEGARRLLSGVAVALVDCDGLGDDGDVDTVEQLRVTAGGLSSPWRSAAPLRAPSAPRSPQP